MSVLNGCLGPLTPRHKVSNLNLIYGALPLFVVCVSNSSCVAASSVVVVSLVRTNTTRSWTTQSSHSGALCSAPPSPSPRPASNHTATHASHRSSS